MTEITEKPLSKLSETELIYLEWEKLIFKDGFIWADYLNHQKLINKDNKNREDAQSNSSIELIIKMIVNLTSWHHSLQHDYILCDPNLVVLKIVSSQKKKYRVKTNEITPGYNFSKPNQRRNPFVLAESYGKLVGVSEKNHSNLEVEYSLAAPIVDMEENILGYIGVLNLSKEWLNLTVLFLNMLLIAIESVVALSYKKDKDKNALEIKEELMLEKKLTPREKTICQLLLQGYSSDDIGVELGLTVASVRTYRKRIYRKFDVSGLGGLLAIFNKND